MNQKQLTLAIDSKKKISSHYQGLTGYVPEEFSQLVQSFNQKSKDWKMEISETYLNLGEQNYCFPDFVIKGPEEQTFYLEIFHKWHSRSLKQRLALLARKPQENLILSVSKALLKDESIKKSVDQSVSNGVRVVGYASFPTAKALLTYLL